MIFVRPMALSHRLPAIAPLSQITISPLLRPTTSHGHHLSTSSAVISHGILMVSFSAGNAIEVITAPSLSVSRFDPRPVIHVHNDWAANGSLDLFGPNHDLPHDLTPEFRVRATITVTLHPGRMSTSRESSAFDIRAQAAPILTLMMVTFQGRWRF